MGIIRPMVRVRETLQDKCYRLGLVEVASGAKLDPELGPQVEALTKALLQELINHIPWCVTLLYVDFTIRKLYYTRFRIAWYITLSA